MTKCGTAPRLLLWAVLIAGPVALSGCPPKEEGLPAARKGERAEEALSAEPPLPPAGGGADSDQPHRPTPGLPKPIDAMTNAELFAYLDTLVYEKAAGNKHRLNRACLKADGSPCNPGDSTEVLVQPEWGMNDVSATAIPANGVVVARFVNYGSHTEAEYRLPPGRRAWWLVDRNSSGQLRSRMITRTYADTGKTYGNDTLTYTFADCGHQRAAKSDAKARWATCADAGRIAAEGSTMEVRITPVSMPAGAVQLKASSWVTCSLGCCIAGL